MDSSILLKSAYEAVVQEGGWAYLPQVRNALITDARFKPFTSEKLSSLFKRFADVFELDLYRVRLKSV